MPESPSSRCFEKPLPLWKMNCEKSKRVPITLVFEALGFQPPVKRPDGLWYFSITREETKPSVKVFVETNSFKDYGDDRYSGDSLDAVEKYRNLTTRGMLDWFEDRAKADSRFIVRDGAAQYTPKYTPKSYSESFGYDKKPGAGDFETQDASEKLIEILEVRKLENKTLISYLESRKININTARLYLEEADFLIGEKKKPVFSLAFRNNSGGRELMNKGFKGCVSPKDVSLWVKSNSSDKTPLLIKKKKNWIEWQNENPESSKSLLVFEASIDFLSALTYRNKAVFDIPALVLNSSGMSKRAVALINDFGFDKIYYFGDNDGAGDSALKVLKGNLEGARIWDYRRSYEGFKDFNEFICRA